jgi:hypothetical protein
MTNDRHVGSRVGITPSSTLKFWCAAATAPKRSVGVTKLRLHEPPLLWPPNSRPSWTRYLDRTPLRMVRPMTIFCQLLCLDPGNSRGERLSCHGVGKPKPSRIGLRWGSLRRAGPSPHPQALAWAASRSPPGASNYAVCALKRCGSATRQTRSRMLDAPVVPLPAINRQINLWAVKLLVPAKTRDWLRSVAVGQRSSPA